MNAKPTYKMEAKDEKCHDLYVKGALEHINTALDCLHMLSKYSNINTFDLSNALYNELEKKVLTNPAYNEAYSILCKLWPEKFEPLKFKIYNNL